MVSNAESQNTGAVGKKIRRKEMVLNYPKKEYTYYDTAKIILLCGIIFLTGCAFRYIFSR